MGKMRPKNQIFNSNRPSPTPKPLPIAETTAVTSKKSTPRLPASNKPALNSLDNFLISAVPLVSVGNIKESVPEKLLEKVDMQPAEDIEVYYEIDQAQGLEGKLKRKEVLVHEQQKKVKSLKQRITRLEEEARNRNRTIASYQTELIQFSKDLEEKKAQIGSLEGLASNLRQELENRPKNLPKNPEGEERFKIAEKEILAIRTELKQKQQDNLMITKELKESKRVYRELQESFDLLLGQNTDQEKQISELRKFKEDMDTRYSKTLDNLKAEVRLRQGECSKLLRDLQEFKKEKEDLERLVDGLELKAEMLGSNNSSLQRKLDKVNRQKAGLEEQLNHGIVRAARFLVRFFSRRNQDTTHLAT